MRLSAIYRWVLLVAFVLICCVGQAQISGPVTQAAPGGVNTSQINHIIICDSHYTSIQACITAAGTTYSVIVPTGQHLSETYSNPNSIGLLDLRTGTVGLPVTRVIETTVDGYGNPILAPTVSDPSTCTVVPIGMTVQSWTIITDLPGSITFSVNVAPASTMSAPGTSYSIVASAPPTIAGTTFSSNSTLTGWSTTIPAGSSVCLTVNSAVGVTLAKLTLILQG